MHGHFLFIGNDKDCLSKELTYHTLQHVVRTPRLYSSDEVERYPVFVKPKIGYGAKGTCKINSRKEIGFFHSREGWFVDLRVSSGRGVHGGLFYG